MTSMLSGSTPSFESSRFTSCLVAALFSSSNQYLPSRLKMRVKKICIDHQCSLILVTHPKKGRKEAIGLDELSGGASYNRFSQSVIWIHHMDEFTHVECQTDLGRKVIECNKIIHMNKTRNGKGHGKKIGFRFDGGLEFAEQGLVTNMKPEKED